MEDAVDAIVEFGGAVPTEFYAVYDGHGGTVAVEYVKRQLPLAIGGRIAHSEGEALRQALHDAFAATDASLLVRLQANELPTPGGGALSSGCVAVIALVRDRMVYIAHVGDSRAIICSKDIVALTVDHRAEAHEGERERLTQLGIEVSIDGYVDGHIGVSRAFGNFAWDSGQKLCGIIGVPEVISVEVTADTEFLLLACDGVFEKMNTKAAGQIVRRRLRMTGSAKDAAEELVKHAGKRDGSDNLSAVVVLFKRPPSEGERVAPRRFQLTERPEPPAEHPDDG